MISMECYCDTRGGIAAERMVTAVTHDDPKHFHMHMHKDLISHIKKSCL